MAASLGTSCQLRVCKLCGTLHTLHKRFTGSTAREIKETHHLSSARQNRQKWLNVIGLEIHAQINSASKLFSGAGTRYGGNTNTQVAFFDAALPGTLPVLNMKCVQAGVLTALALGSDINLVSKFDRKHYFYADLPAGYQITQQRKPIAVNGEVTYVYQCSRTNYAERRSAKLVQIQLEQDSGKSLHDGEQGLSLIDLNRAGVGLMEIVTAPDFTSGDDAASFVRDLRDILVTIGTCDGKMAEGSLRVDANISVHRQGEPWGTRTEVKNLNSLRSIRAAIDYEIERQIQVIEDGGVIENETRSFDVADGETVPMRDKEKVLDYRFMPEPNLPPLVIHMDRSSIPSSMLSTNNVVLEDVKTMMTKLPDAKRKWLENIHGLPLTTAVIIVRAGLSDTLETLIREYRCDPLAASSVLKGSYASYLDDIHCHPSQSPISNEKLAEIIHIYGNKEISGSTVSHVLREISTNSQKTCQEIIVEQNLWAIKDESIIWEAIEGVFSRNPKIVKAYKKGKTNQLDILLTKVVKQLDKKTNFARVQQMILEKLKQ